MNRLWVPSTFKRLLKEKREAAPQATYNGVKSAIVALRASPLPHTLGEHKQMGLLDTYGYRIGPDVRLLYAVRPSDGIYVVALLRVCSHGRTYNPDTLTVAESAFFSLPSEAVIQEAGKSEEWVTKIQDRDKRRQLDYSGMYR